MERYYRIQKISKSGEPSFRFVLRDADQPDLPVEEITEAASPRPHNAINHQDNLAHLQGFYKGTYYENGVARVAKPKPNTLKSNKPKNGRG